MCLGLGFLVTVLPAVMAILQEARVLLCHPLSGPDAACTSRAAELSNRVALPAGQLKSCRFASMTISSHSKQGTPQLRDWQGPALIDGHGEGAMHWCQDWSALLHVKAAKTCSDAQSGSIFLHNEELDFTADTCGMRCARAFPAASERPLQDQSLC